jgi:eukaryotic-like serine/threonine-protein kinase
VAVVFPVQAGESLISQHGGRAPRWRRDGRELFFLTLNGMLMAAHIDTVPSFTPSSPEPLFQTGLTSANTYHPYAVGKDGQRFLIPIEREDSGSTPITIVLNWPANLAK